MAVIYFRNKHLFKGMEWKKLIESTWYSWEKDHKRTSVKLGKGKDVTSCPPGGPALEMTFGFPELTYPAILADEEITPTKEKKNLKRPV
jgi:hypothetical protein